MPLTILELLLLLTADGVVGICSSLLGVVVDEVGVGSADVIELTTVLTLPIIGDEESTIMGELSFFVEMLLLLLPIKAVVENELTLLLSFDRLFEDKFLRRWHFARPNCAGVGAKMNCCLPPTSFCSSSASTAEAVLPSELRLPPESGGFKANVEVEHADFGVVGNDLYGGDFGVASV